MGERGPKPENLLYRTFNKLTVVGQATINNHLACKHHNGPMWICECACGGMTVVRSSDLKSGHTKSCGCLRGKEPEVCECEEMKYHKAYCKSTIKRFVYCPWCGKKIRN